MPQTRAVMAVRPLADELLQTTGVGDYEIGILLSRCLLNSGRFNCLQATPVNR